MSHDMTTVFVGRHRFSRRSNALQHLRAGARIREVCSADVDDEIEITLVVVQTDLQRPGSQCSTKNFVYFLTDHSVCVQDGPVQISIANRRQDVDGGLVAYAVNHYA